MPFCSRCGNQVTDADVYCSKCGATQRGARTQADFAANLTPRTASILCYIPWVGWIAAIVVLASSAFRDNRTVRFHAFQGLYLFVAWLIVQWVSFPMHFMPWQVRVPFGSLLQLAILGLWVFMIIKTSREETYSLPVIGELAEKSLSE
jgi:uncharacterized membrane protein